MKRTSLFLALCVALLRLAGAQPSLGIFSNTVFATPDTVSFNDSVTFNFDVVNTGNQAFSGSFFVFYSVNNNFVDTLDSLNSFVQIDTGASYQLTVSNHIISSSIYAVGDNIVVIWPVAISPNVSTTDSGLVHIQVDSLLAITPSILDKKIKAFYRSSDQSVIIVYGDMISHIRDVMCYSVLGREIAKYDYGVNKISFAEHSPEIMLLTIRTKEGESITFKILRM